MAIPGAVALGEEKADDGNGAMRGLDFSSGGTERKAFHGLPMRLQWQLYVKLLGWRSVADETGTQLPPEARARAALGADAHFFLLESSVGPRTSARLEPPPLMLMTSYQPRKDKLRISLVASTADAEIGYCFFALKDLTPLKARVGWVKIKSDIRDEKGRRTPVGKVEVGLLLSEPQKAPTLFLIDFRDRHVLFYQEAPTLEDLNPVFDQHSMTPFSWAQDSQSGLFNIINPQRHVVASLDFKKKDLSLVDIVRVDQEEYWQCSVTEDFETAEFDRAFRVDGSWTGRILWRPRNRFVSVFSIVSASSSDTVARAEWRNARDLKLSVDASTEDPLTAIALLIAARELMDYGPRKK